VKLSKLSGLLVYPGPDYQARVDSCLVECEPSGISEFAATIAGLPSEAVQELYTQTFDWNPDTTLDIGWHLFGENYDRGDFLVKLRSAMREYGLPESGELPDHLSHVLPLLDHMPADERAPFAEKFLLPALEKLASGLQKTESAFLPLIQAIQAQVSATLEQISSGAAHA
jgi:nitrate reductase delta subunit